MEKQTYNKRIEVPTEMLVTEPVLVDQIKDRVKMELIDGLVEVVTPGNEYVVSLSNIIETQNYIEGFMTQFTQYIRLVPLVRCKNCKHNRIAQHETGFVACELRINAKDDNWFCKDGERREDE